MSSSISAARVALNKLLVEAAADIDSSLYKAQVVFGDPLNYEEQRVVAMLGITGPSELPADIGNFAHQEEYRLVLRVKSHDPAGEAATVDADAFGLADGVRKVVNQNATLSRTVQMSYVVAQLSDGAQPAQEGGWVCFIDLHVYCRAMPLTP